MFSIFGDYSNLEKLFQVLNIFNCIYNIQWDWTQYSYPCFHPNRNDLQLSKNKVYRTRKVTKGKNMRTINIYMLYSCIVDLQELVMNDEFLHSEKKS